MEKTKKRAIGKAINTLYGIKTTGKHLKNWHAKPMAENVFKIIRHDGSEITVNKGDEIGKVGKVDVDELGHVRVGAYSVLVGPNIHNGLIAKKTRGKDNYIFTVEGEKRKIKLSKGDTLPGFGVIGDIDNRGQLQVGNGTAPIEEKIMELKLLVFDTESKIVPGAKEASFQLIMAESKDATNSGVLGAFVPASGPRPGTFYEKDAELGKLSTALFWPSKHGSFTNTQIRSLESAKKERLLFKKKVEIEKEAKELEIDPEDHQDYEKVNEMLAGCKNDWDQKAFSVFFQKEIFGIEEEMSMNY